MLKKNQGSYRTFDNLEKSWKNHGILLVNRSGNPEKKLPVRPVMCLLGSFTGREAAVPSDPLRPGTQHDAGQGAGGEHAERRHR